MYAISIDDDPPEIISAILLSDAWFGRLPDVVTDALALPVGHAVVAQRAHPRIVVTRPC